MVESLHFDIQSTGQKSHCVNTISGHRNARFLLNCRILLAATSSESIVHCEQLSYYTDFRSQRSHPCGRPCQPLGPVAGATRPILRANPFPEVTDPICRLPLPTLFQTARGCEPRRPDAVMGTDSSVLSRSDFQGTAWTHLMPPKARHSSGAAAFALDNPLPRPLPR